MESVKTAFQLAYSIAKENEIEVSIPIKHIPDIERTRFEHLQFFGADELSKPKIPLTEEEEMESRLDHHPSSKIY